MTTPRNIALCVTASTLLLGACGPAPEGAESEFAEILTVKAETHQPPDLTELDTESTEAETSNINEAGEVSAQTFAGDLGSAVGSPVATYTGTCTASNDWRLTCGTSGSREVVYVWKAPETGTYNFNTRLSDYDTVLEIRDYKNTTRVLACNDDTPATFQSSIDLSLSRGAHLLILVDGYETSCGTARLSIFKR